MARKPRTVISLAALAALGAIGGGSLAIHAVTDAVRAAVVKDIEHLTTATAARIDGFLRARAAEATVFARARAVRPGDEYETGQLLRALVAESAEIRRLSLAGTDGVVITSSEESLRNLRIPFAHPDSYRLLVRSHDLLPGEVLFEDAAAGDDGVTMSFITPSRRVLDDGRVEPAIFVSSVAPARIVAAVDWLASVTPAEKATYLVNEEGRVMHDHSGRHATMAPLAEMQPDGALVAVLKSGGEGSREYVDPDGERVVAAFAELPRYGVNAAGGWMVLTVSRRAALFAPARSVRALLVVVAAVYSAMLGIGGFAVGRRA